MMIIKIADDYTKTPGGRRVGEGNYTGEDFRKRFLEPKYKAAVQNGEYLTVDLDGGYGYPPSFLEESFGGLARELRDKNILKNIKIISNDEPSLIKEIEGYVESAF